MDDNAADFIEKVDCEELNAELTLVPIERESADACAVCWTTDGFFTGKVVGPCFRSNSIFVAYPSIKADIFSK